MRIFAWLFILIPAFALFLPWRQNVSGAGYVSAVTPLERQQTVDSPVSGRILQWHTMEGAKVKKGDLLVEISDIDPLLPERLERQREANIVKLDAKHRELASYEIQIDSLLTVRDMKVTAAQYKLDMARQKVTAASEALVSAQASYDTAQLQQKRFSRLLGDGLVSRRDFEVAERDEIVGLRSLNSAKAALQSAKAEQNAAQADIDQIRADAQAKIDSTIASKNKILGEIEDIRNNLVDNEVSIARQQSQRVTAPRDGTVLRLLLTPKGQMIKQNDPLLTLVPNIDARGVEVWVSGNDAPLILPGHHARLVFEGWPAIQFVGGGWPEVAAGTFGGTVAFVDPSDNGLGKFRVMIVPDESDQPWPPERFLRQGGAVRAWVLLEQVSVGFEIWRQLNAFPPNLTPEHPYREADRIQRHRMSDK